MKPNYQLLLGDNRKVLSELPDESAHCVVTSPPYWGLRDYGTAEWIGGDPDCDHVADPNATKKMGNPEFNKNRPSREETKTAGYHAPVCPKCGAVREDPQIGLEEVYDCGMHGNILRLRDDLEPEDALLAGNAVRELQKYFLDLKPCGECYVCHIVEIFREIRRVLRDDGTAWLNLGDSYMGSGGAGGWSKRKGGDQEYVGQRGNNANRTSADDVLKPKDLCMIPARVAQALQADGWWLRSDIIWAKGCSGRYMGGNPMPESVKDRPSQAHEHIFLLAKSRIYFYDSDAIREPVQDASVERSKHAFNPNQDGKYPDGHEQTWKSEQFNHPNGRNRRNVWVVPTKGLKEAHFAVFPEELITPCVLAGTSTHGVCEACGAPWERVTEKRGESTYEQVKEESWRQMNEHATEKGIVPSRPNSGQTRLPNGTQPHLDITPREHTGWQPTCTCGAGVVPATILDPFNGAGTTGLTALKNGRNYVGIDVNKDYLEMTRERLDPVMKEIRGEIAPLVANDTFDDLPLFNRSET